MNPETEYYEKVLCKDETPSQEICKKYDTDLGELLWEDGWTYPEQTNLQSPSWWYKPISKPLQINKQETDEEVAEAYWNKNYPDNFDEMLRVAVKKHFLAGRSSAKPSDSNGHRQEGIEKIQEKWDAYENEHRLMASHLDSSVMLRWLNENGYLGKNLYSISEVQEYCRQQREICSDQITEGVNEVLNAPMPDINKL